MVLYMITFIAVAVALFQGCGDEESENPAPSITGFTPDMGAVGSTVVISGENFDTVAVNNTVKFFGHEAEVIAEESSTRQLSVLVPAEAVDNEGTISVTTNNKTTTSTDQFRATQ